MLAGISVTGMIARAEAGSEHVISASRGGRVGDGRSHRDVTQEEGRAPHSMFTRYLHATRESVHYARTFQPTRPLVHRLSVERVHLM